MKILGYEFKKVKPTVEAEKKTWERLFITGQSMTLSNSVSKPYEKIATVFKAVKAIGDNIPQAENKIYDKVTGAEVDEQNLLNLFNNPNPRQSGNDFLQEWASYYALYGEGFIHMVESLGQRIGNSKLPAEMVVLDPKSMTEVVNNKTRELTKWKYGNATEFFPEQIIHSKDFNPYNHYRGLPPLAPIEDEIFIDQASLDFNRYFFNNDATPNLFLSTDQRLSEEQRKQILVDLENRHQGTDKKHRTGILAGGLKAQSISPSHREMEFIEQKKLMREEILGIWRVPKALFSFTDDLNYATFMGQMRIFWEYTLAPIMRKYEDSVNRYIVTPYNPRLRFSFDRTNVPAYQAEFGEKVTTAQTLFNMGFTANEINALFHLGFDDKAWRDEWWLSMGMLPASQSLENPYAMYSDTEEPEEKPKENKTFDQAPQRTIKQLAIEKSFLRRQMFLESKLEGKISKYFFKLRTELLKTPDDVLASGNITIDWDKQNEELKKMVQPIIEQGIQEGAELGKDILGKGIEDDALKYRLQSFLTIRVDKIKQINNSVRKQIAKAIEQGLKQGEGTLEIARNIAELSASVRRELRGVFNNVGTRAKLIARTETATAVNGGSYIFYEKEGVSKVEWLTARDEFVRDSHRACERQGAIQIGHKFSNGLRYPNDMENGSPSEVINCRCVISPIGN